MCELALFVGAWFSQDLPLQTGIARICVIMIHIGKIIEAEMKRQERTPAWLARKINCVRTQIYYIYKQESINTDTLLRISKALNFNFFTYYDNEYNAKNL